MTKKQRNKIVSLVLCTAVVLATVLTPNVSYAAEEADLISQGLVTYENHTDVANYRGETKTAPDAPTGKVFAGWYEEKGGVYTALNAAAADAAETAYAKFVDANVFDAKFQLTEDTTNVSEKTNIRLITTVDTVNYATVGFNVTFGSKTLYCGSEKVYAQINAFVDETANPIQPTVFSNASGYFVTHSIKNVPNNAFNNEWTIVPTWTTIDGTVVEATGDAIETFYVNQYAEVYPYDLEEGVTFEDERDLYYVEGYKGTDQYHTTSSLIEEYDGSKKLAIRPVKFDSGGGAYPHLHLNLGKTYPAGSKITYYFRYNGTASQSMVITGYKDGAVVTGGVDGTDNWAEKNYTYSSKTITLLKECDAIDIWFTMKADAVAYYDNFKIVVPIDLEEGLDFETASSMQYISQNLKTDDWSKGWNYADYSRDAASGRLAVKGLKDQECWPTITLSLGKTYEAGTKITFEYLWDATGNTGKTLSAFGYNQGQAVSGAIQWGADNAGTYVQMGYSYTKEITLLQPCDQIMIQGTVKSLSDTLYYDNFKVVVPQVVVPALETGLTFEDESDLDYISQNLKTDDWSKAWNYASFSRDAASGRLAVKGLKDQECWPTITLSLGKTYAAGTKITFDYLWDATGNTGKSLSASGYNQGQAVSGAIQWGTGDASTYVQMGYTYTKEITLLQPCDQIMIQGTVMSLSDTLYYDNFLVTPPAAE